MPVQLAYLLIMFIWATGPLAIQWSIQGPGFLFASTARFAVAVIFLGLVTLLTREWLPLHRAAILTYICSACGFYAFLLMAWALQYIPSGWMAITYGLSPLLTAMMAAVWLGDRSMTSLKVIGMLTGLVGLLVIFATAIELGPMAVYGMLAMFCGVVLANASTVWIKRLDARINPRAVTTGGVGIAFVAYMLTWLVFDGNYPVQLPQRSLLAIVYVGVLGTGVVFMLFYFLLGRIALSRIALLGVLVPVLALILGNIFNSEPLTARIFLGTGLIVISIVLQEFLPLRRRPDSARRRVPQAQKNRPGGLGRFGGPLDPR